MTTNEMANLSNIDRDTGQPERVPFDLGSAIYDVVEALATTAAAEDTDLLGRSHLARADVCHDIKEDTGDLAGAIRPLRE
ncbi:MAG TPA: hypothetical protein QF624_06075 [Dehalococcoidia bacterium]|nr:hypothetical protein [Dehalococcoidia bacterium]